MDDLIAELFARVNYERQLPPGPDSFKLRNMRCLLAELGNPELAYPVIHVAGTKGKGSVSTMIASILTAAGIKTGLYTSPHLESLEERLVIDGQAISPAELQATLKRLQPAIAAVESARPQPAGTAAGTPENAAPPAWNGTPATDPDLPSQLTFFEIVTAAALEYFAQQRCQAVVLEVGLGGRLDSTNVCQPEVCVITSISFDHTRQLGNTLPEIAAEKAGIIKPGVPIVSGVSDESAKTVIRQIADQRQAPWLQLGQHFQVIPGGGASPAANFGCRGRLPLAPPGADIHAFEASSLQLQLPGRHQRQNACLAVTAIETLRAGGWEIPASAIAAGLAGVAIPGRTERVIDQPAVVLDIAHNPASVSALLTALREECPAWQEAPRRHLIFGTSQDKDAAAMLAELGPAFDDVWLTQFQNNPRALELSRLQPLADELWPGHGQQACSSPQIHAVPTPLAAWEAVQQQAGPQDLVLITGSAFLVAELRSPLRALAAAAASPSTVAEGKPGTR